MQMETVIKQAEENRNRSIGIANRVHEEYLPLKHEIDHMRREYLGLNPLPDLHEEEGSTISAEYVFHCNHSISSPVPPPPPVQIPMLMCLVYFHFIFQTIPIDILSSSKGYGRYGRCE